VECWSKIGRTGPVALLRVNKSACAREEGAVAFAGRG